LKPAGQNARSGTQSLKSEREASNQEDLIAQMEPWPSKGRIVAHALPEKPLIVAAYDGRQFDSQQVERKRRQVHFDDAFPRQELTYSLAVEAALAGPVRMTPVRMLVPGIVAGFVVIAAGIVMGRQALVLTAVALVSVM
jgi:hypothetical protein